MYSRFFKRLIDVLGAIVLLIMLLPLLLVVSACLAWDFRGSPFYFAVRPGKNEMLFRLVKFRTMSTATSIDGRPRPDEERITRLGALVRRWSLDELPQLINVLVGDMSLIGPRPLAQEYLVLYSDEQRRRHDVLPGITGWAQVNGRNDIEWSKKFMLDLEYVDNITFLLDFRIAWLTLVKVISREGVNEEGQAVVESFNGHN